MEEELRKFASVADVDAVTLRNAKRFGFSDRQLATIWRTSEMEIRQHRKSQGIVATSSRSTRARPNSRPTRPILLNIRR